MTGRIKLLTVQRQEIAELAKTRDELDKLFPQTFDQKEFCDNVDKLVEMLIQASGFERITYNEVNYLDAIIERQQMQLYELKNN